MKDLSALCRLLGDDARLRLLRVLTLERLNVKELTAVLGLAQSGVSRHLGLLKEAGLVQESREGGYVYYAASESSSPSGPPSPPLVSGARGERGERAATRRGSSATTGRGVEAPRGASGAAAAAGRGDTRGSTADGLLADVWGVLRHQFAAAANDPAVRADEARLAEVLRLRKENFETHGAEARQLVPGRSWAAWSRALGHLLPPLVVADLGCGEGYLSLEAARWAEHVTAIDRSADVLARARALAKRRRVDNVTWKVGELEKVPLPDASVDVALLSQALHHAVRPGRALAEAARIVKPGGHVLVLDLRTHDQAWVKARLGDRWLGFDEDALRHLLSEAGLDPVKLETGARLKGDPFTVIVASGRKPRADEARREAEALRHTGQRDPGHADTLEPAHPRLHLVHTRPGVRGHQRRGLPKENTDGE